MPRTKQNAPTQKQKRKAVAPPQSIVEASAAKQEHDVKLAPLQSMAPAAYAVPELMTRERRAQVQLSAALNELDRIEQTIDRAKERRDRAQVTMDNNEVKRQSALKRIHEAKSELGTLTVQSSSSSSSSSSSAPSISTSLVASDPVYTPAPTLHSELAIAPTPTPTPIPTLAIATASDPVPAVDFSASGELSQLDPVPISEKSHEKTLAQSLFGAALPPPSPTKTVKRAAGPRAKKARVAKTEVAT